MSPPDFLTKANYPAGLDLTHNLRRELQLQQIAMSVSIQWGVYPVILLAVSGLWHQVAHVPLLVWCAAATLVSLATVYNSRRNRRLLLTAADTVPDFTQRNTAMYVMVGTVWGSLPLLSALFGTQEASWFSLVISLASLASLALILSTTQIVFAAAMLPAGLLVLIAIGLSPLPRLELIAMSIVYIAVMTLLHRTLFRMQVDRVRASVNQAAQALALVRMLEHHDPLTGLLNRAGLEDWIDTQVPSFDDNPRALIVMGTIVGFTELNALYGAQVADSLLAAVARRLTDASRGTLGIARLGGAEFIVVDLRPDTDPQTLLRLFATLESKPYDAAGQLLTIGMRQAWVRGNVREIGALVELARARLQTQHDADDSLAALGLAQRRELVRDFHRALVSGDIQAWFQPIVDCRTNALYGWEALVRWRHPRHGQLLPSTFLTIARVARQMPELTRLVLHTSARFVRALRQQGQAAAARVHLNVTVSELGNPQTLDWMERIIEETGVAPDAIVVELTEKDALIVDEQLARNLARMQRIGMPLAIDDFGTGHSNLSRLLDLPADAIKIDKRFVDQLPHDRHSAALVRSMTTLASGLGMRVIAEGVEQQSQLDFLRGIGCDACQGFRFSAALPLDAALRFAATWPATGSV
ncbi:MAG TPA: bifunctional diguanylate cyclase/phosphodiesterase [Pseudomonadales bacterium]